MTPRGACVDAIRKDSFRSVARVERVSLSQTPIDAISRLRLSASLVAAAVSRPLGCDRRAPALPGQSRHGLTERKKIGLRHMGLVALVIGISQANADIPWRSV